MDKVKEEWHKMLNGEIYDAALPEFLELLMQTREKLYEFNNLPPRDIEAQHKILRDLLGSCGKNIIINQPFRCDYGCNIHLGENFMANFNLTVLDEAEVRIGRNAFIGPNVNIFTACHPLEADARATGAEWAEPVTIGDDVWIGGGTTILPGVTIGDRVVIGAGSVVTKDIPSDSVAVGNPARVIKKISQK